MNELPESFWNALHAWRSALDACDRAQSVEEGQAAFKEVEAAAKVIEREVAALSSGGPTEGHPK
jgi:cell division protein FtsB